MRISEGNKKTIKINIAAPARIKLVLKQVDQDLFRNLSQLLGRRYFENFESSPVKKSGNKEEEQFAAEQEQALLDRYLQEIAAKIHSVKKSVGIGKYVFDCQILGE